MESGSENSFAWTDTSSDSFNSSTKDATEVNSFEKIGLDNNHKMKGKEKKSFSKNKNEEDNEINIKEEHSEVNNMKHLKKKKIKLEPESDSDITNKIKINQFEINGNQPDSQNSETYDETFLDMKVKLEESTLPTTTKKKKSKKKRRSSIVSNVSSTSTKLKCDTHDELINGTNHNNLAESESETGKTKSKKKKKKTQEISQNSDEEIEDKIEIGETTISKQDVSYKTLHQHNTVNHSVVTENHSIEDESDENSCNEISAIKCDNDITHTISFIDKSTTGKALNISVSETSISSPDKQAPNKVPRTISLNITDPTKQRTPRISERLLFEEDDHLDHLESSPEQDKDYTSSKNTKKTKQFLKGNPNLKLVTQQLYNSNLTQDDEVWILKCPKEIDVSSFAGKKINIHGKCKIKFDGQTYDGSAEDDIQSNTLTVLTMEHNNYKINNLPLNGIISLRKRIPKAHFHDDNVMVNNQTNFIPLPETKCRHPLFGSNYKKALKIPASIAERLNVQDNIETTLKTEKRKKKKHKSDKNTLEQENPVIQDTVMKTEPDLTTNVSEKKKKKKRKISVDGDAAPKKKRIKHDPESAEAWESEKAIEENLFNY
ncbi:unnamed protein product [Chrysodeixis includens]|uniref:Uncharacterized protein n=1 Tax=Chrysodeixis includens TaxID=689277 RepID=A0A9P0C3I5_CHRIL|nr:unnamed protein product [Chrysodeixis includens]